MFDCLVEKGSLWRRRGGAFFALLFFFLFLLGLTPDKACANEYQTPEGYDHYEYQKLVSFLEYSDSGVKNGEKINPAGCNPADPETWTGVKWSSGGNKRVRWIIWQSKDLAGSLDVSGFLSLEELNCGDNRLLRLDARNCPVLQNLFCTGNGLQILEVSGCSALGFLDCRDNNLASLDVSGCPLLWSLDCSDNKMTFSTLPLSLPVSGGTYKYSPQKQVPIGVEGKIVAGAKVDLSAEAVIGGTPTRYFWYSDDVMISLPTQGVGVFII